jgi:hypothetical protein
MMSGKPEVYPPAQLAALAEALPEFTSVADLQTWLTEKD